MSETLEISKENALKAFEEANDKGKTLLSNLFGKKTFQKDLLERLNTDEDVILESGLTMSEWEEIIDGLDVDEAAYKFLKLLINLLRKYHSPEKPWKPNWKDPNEKKWNAVWNMNDKNDPEGFGFSYAHYDYWSTDTAVGSRLCLPTEKLLLFATSKYKHKYREFLTEQ